MEMVFRKNKHSVLENASILLKSWTQKVVDDRVWKFEVLIITYQRPFNNIHIN